MIKLVATDIDGTILGKSLEFTSGVKNCIRLMQDNGIKVVIVTGRMFAAAKLIARRLNLKTPVVAYQGGMIKENSDSDNILYEACIPQDDIQRIIDWGRKNKAHLNLYSNDVLYVEEDNETIKRYASAQNIDYNVCSFDDIELKNVHKLLAIDYQNADLVTNWIKECQESLPHLYIVKSTPYFCEFSSHDASKSCAVNFLKKYWDLKDEEVLTIGDQDNDIELLKAGGIRVAMGNGTEGVKKEADFITDTVDNDGFVKAMEKFVLGDIKCSK